MSETLEADRLTLRDARDIAAVIIAELGHACERLEIAGSIRRRAQTVGDIELLAVPKVERIPIGLFPEDLTEVDRLNTAVDRLLDREPWHWSLRPRQDGVTVNGPRYKRLLYTVTDGSFGPSAAVDLFICKPPAQWGVLQVIRTGPNRFSKRCVAHLNVRLDDGSYGWLPHEMRVQDGQLWDRGALVPTPTELDFFSAIGQPWREPWERR